MKQQQQQQRRLFASCLLAFATSALQLEAQTTLAASQYHGSTGELSTKNNLQNWAPDDDCCMIYNDYDSDPLVVCLDDGEFTYGDLPTYALDEEGDYILDENEDEIKIYQRGVDCGQNAFIVLRWNSVGREMAHAGKSRIRWSQEEEHANRHNKYTIGPYDETTMPAVNLFGDADCQGTDTSFLLYNEGRGSYAGEFGSDDITLLRKSNQIKSVSMRSGYSVALFSEDSWKGNSQTIVGAYEITNDGRLACQNISDAELLTTGVNSIRIMKQQQGEATGYWTGMTSTEAQTFTFSVGVSTSNGSSSTESAVSTLENSASLGFNASMSVGVTASAESKVKAGFLGNGASAKVAVEASVEVSAGVERSSAYGQAISDEVSKEINSTASQDITTVHETTCTPLEGDTRVGLWQWVVTSEDYSVSAYTAHTVCRSGDLAAVSPTCAWWDCNNSDCSECQSTVALEEEEDEEED